MMIEKLKDKLKQWFKKVTLKGVAKTFLVLLVLYLLLAYFAVNPIAKKLIPRIAEKSLASQASVGSVQFDPFRLKTTINDFQLANQNGVSLARFKKLVVDFELSGMFDLAWKFKKVGVAEPQLNFAITPDGAFNWEGLIAKLNESQSPPSDTIPSLVIEQIIVEQGKVQYADANRLEPINTVLTPLSFELEGLSTLPKDRGEYFISAAFAKQGGTLQWKGDMSVNPVASKGVFALNGVKISKVLQLVKGLTLPVSIDEGEAQTSFNYDFSLPKAVPTLAIKDFTFSVRELAGKLAQGGDIALAYAALSAPTLHFVKNEQSTLRVDGIELSLKELLLNQRGGMQLTLKESAASLPQFNFSVEETPQLAFEDLNLHLSELNINQNKQFSLALPQTDVKSVSADLAGGKVSIKEVMTSDMQFNGREVTKQPLAILSTATIEDSLILLQEKKVSVQSILFSGLETSVIKQADKKLNWVSALESQSASKKVDLAGKTKSAEAGSGESAWQVALAKVALNNGNIHIQDKSVPTPIVMDVVGASAEIQNASLDMAKALPVKAAFKVKQGGQFSTKGTMRPSPFSADLGLRLSQLSLRPFPLI